jgi:hypothetical protein
MHLHFLWKLKPVLESLDPKIPTNFPENGIPEDKHTENKQPGEIQCWRQINQKPKITFP